MAEKLALKIRYRLKKPAKREGHAAQRVIESVADDLNALLAPVMGVFADLQEEKFASPEQRRRYDLGISCMLLSRLLVRQLLDCANPRQLRPVNIDVGQFLSSLEPALRSALSRDVRPCFDVPRNLPPIYCDQQLMVRALLSLVLDARTGMPNGGEVLISAGVDLLTEPLRPMIRLSVSKRNGCEYSSHAGGNENCPFETEMRGMAVVRQIVENQGGKLAVGGSFHTPPGVHMWLPIGSATK
ncbi:HAMP domain-containing histidine kinase [Ensifer adhaerens]|uniref:HAMP domain-containing histidine kinase n=1 Tax=Ensifer TaxID=106591 RepID=UPI001782774F|nr:HAMP domain-containing histidine kinase [Ensifer sp. ENS08]MBD9570801.1 HAMP domain-containing histidine kinase [Ensifer sp. ENS08]